MVNPAHTQNFGHSHTGVAILPAGRRRSALADAIEAGFSSLDLDHAFTSPVLIESATRCESPLLTTTIGLNPNNAFVSFDFGTIVKRGMNFRYPAAEANDEEIENFIYDLIGAAASNDA